MFQPPFIRSAQHHKTYADIKDEAKHREEWKQCNHETGQRIWWWWKTNFYIFISHQMNLAAEWTIWKNLNRICKLILFIIYPDGMNVMNDEILPQRMVYLHRLWNLRLRCVPVGRPRWLLRAFPSHTPGHRTSVQTLNISNTQTNGSNTNPISQNMSRSNWKTRWSSYMLTIYLLKKIKITSAHKSNFEFHLKPQMPK